MKKWHIFSGGELSDTDFIEILAGEPVICADRGLHHAQKLGIIPDIIVGDFDSFKGKLPENTEILQSIPEKDDTDTMLAVKLAIDRGAEQILLYGALGGRFDHTIANIQTLKYGQEHGCEIRIMDSQNEIMLQTAGTMRYKRRKEWYFSVFAYSEKLKINRLTGVKYPLSDAEITASFPIGVSNEIIEAEAELSISSGTALVIFSKNS